MRNKLKNLGEKFSIRVLGLIFFVCLCFFVILTSVRDLFNEQANFDKVLNQQAKLIDQNLSEYSFRVNSDTEDFTITINTENLCDKGNEEVGIYQQSDWFSIDKDQQYLCMYGSFNYAKWTFADEKGNKTIVDMTDRMYNDMLDTTINNAAKCTVEVPEGSIGAKVIYYKSGAGSIRYIKNIVYRVIKGNFGEAFDEVFQVFDYYKALKNDKLFITYGMVPSSYVTYDTYNVDLEEVSDGAYVIYSKDSGWRIDGNGEEDKPIDIDASIYAGCSIVFDKSCSIELLDGEEEQIDNAGVYGIKYSIESNAIVCERIEDSIGLHSNYLFDNQYALPYNNDFDSIYPWSEIKSCYLDNDGNVYYDISEFTGAEVLSEMIEIPAFYVCRKQEDGEEYICISKEYHDGFEIDPAFINENGVSEKIYVSKYLSSIIDGEIGSYLDAVPAINISLETIDTMVAEKGNGWQEIDLVTLNMIQRLWLVETAVKNTQSIFTGYTESTFIWSNDSDPKYALETEYNSNTIKIVKNDYTSKFEVNDNVIVITYDKEDQYSAYKYFNENYVNDTEKWQRKIVSIEADEDYFCISFSGEPIDIIGGESIIANLPESCGVTNNLSYHTGTEGGREGKNSFKYRNIENLWGNICVVLQGVTVENSAITLVYPSGMEKEVPYVLPEQPKGGSVAKSYECAIRTLWYDEDDNLVMLPQTIGDGATLSNNFGDWFAVPVSDLYLDTTQCQYITYGMTWDLAEYAGLFAYRVQPTYSSQRVENGSRIIYRN